MKATSKITDHPSYSLFLGVTVLVTHLERKPLDPFFRGLLLKQFYVDKDGNKIVKVGDMAFNYHPNFCLYLCSTVPLFVKGKNSSPSDLTNSWTQSVKRDNYICLLTRLTFLVNSFSHILHRNNSII